MAQSATLSCELRDKLGSRAARKLRGAGRIVASLQSSGEKPNLNLHFDAVAFLTSRRQHVHLYDLDIGGGLESAVVRELQWDAMGDHIVHVEFKRVQRGVETESEVELTFYGQVKEGVLTHNVTHITILSMPTQIPDGIEVDVTGLEIGVHVKARDLDLPEGVSLACDPELEIAVVTALRGGLDEPEPMPEAEAALDEAGAEGPEGEGEAPASGDDES